MIRQLGPDFNLNSTAGDLKGTESLLGEVTRLISERGASAMISNKVGAEILRMTNHRRDKWINKANAAKDHRIGYKDDGRGIVGLLQHAGQTPQWQDFTCLDSLRDVEPMVNLVLDERAVGLNPFEAPPSEEELNEQEESEKEETL
ncbi:MAG: hypothetical protein EOP84_32710 [Verrucomicrobiaceae bacterium]|nr:MAG: hypothetical protein EOP84_32710 [Verrucomicrobiaceae bacterium]